MSTKKITKKRVIKAFGSIKGASDQIGVTRWTIYKWIDKGSIPEICRCGPLTGKNWHVRLKSIGFNEDLSRVA